jgi:hypothetical protein
VPICTDDCQSGESGCSDDGLAAWTCGEAGDGDDCLERVFSDCEANAHCESGECVEGCVDECASGETGCSEDELTAWTCGEAGDGDDCLDRVFSDCPTNTHCESGECVEGCVDECAVEEVGCSADLQEAWICGDAQDGDDCLDRIFSDCPTNTHCESGACVDGCVDECASGETGCSQDGLSSWTCGEAGDGDDCLDRVETACADGTTCQAGECVAEPPSSSGSGCGCRLASAKASAGDTRLGPLFSLLSVLALLLIVWRRRHP